MAKLNYKEQLQRLAELQKKVDDARDELALKIGRYVLDNEQDISTLPQFKILWKSYQENNDLFKDL